MKQASLKLNLNVKKTRKQVFLEQMEQVVPWAALSDPGMEEAFFDPPLYREFAQLEEFARLPDESTILRFRHRLEKHQLAAQMLAVVNDILIAAPSLTKNKHHKRNPDMHLSKKGQQKNIAQLVTLFALSNWWMVRGKLMGVQKECARKPGESPAGAENQSNRCKKRRRVEGLRVKFPRSKATDSLRHLTAGYSEYP